MYKIDNRRKNHKGRYTILGIILGVILTGASIYLYDNNRQPILDNVNEVKQFAIKQIPKDSPIVSVVNNDRTTALRIHDLVNQERESNGLGSLTWNDEIAHVADRHSQEMLSTGDFSHTGLSDRLLQMGCPNGSENIEISNGYYLDQVPHVAVNDWMNSYGHRANILNHSFTSEGIGVSQDGDKVLISQNFC